MHPLSEDQNKLLTYRFLESSSMEICRLLPPACSPRENVKRLIAAVQRSPPTSSEWRVKVVGKLLKVVAAEWEEDSRPARAVRKASRRGAKIDGVTLHEAIMALQKVSQGPRWLLVVGWWLVVGGLVGNMYLPVCLTYVVTVMKIKSIGLRKACPNQPTDTQNSNAKRKRRQKPDPDPDLKRGPNFGRPSTTYSLQSSRSGLARRSCLWKASGTPFDILLG